MTYKCKYRIGHPSREYAAVYDEMHDGLLKFMREKYFWHKRLW